MNSQPMVSCIIIFLNEERFIQEAIESVFAQSYDHWELLLVDDGSTDKSTEIAIRYAERYPSKIRYLEHEGHANRGMSTSRNFGIQCAKGTYISFIDGDDVWLPDKLEEQVAILEAHPEVALTHGPMHLWWSWTGHPEDVHRDQLYGGKHPYSDTVVEPPKLLALFLRLEQYIPAGFLAKRDVMAHIGVFEEEFRDAYSDAVALVKLCLKAPVFVSGKSWYKYRKHTESNTYLSGLNGKDDEEQYVYLNWVEMYFHRHGVKDEELLATIRKMLWPHRYPRLFWLKSHAFYNTKRLARSLRSRLRAGWKGQEKIRR